MTSLGGLIGPLSAPIVRHYRTASADLTAALYAHGPLLLAAARTMAANEADAQDLVQATFEIGLRSLPKLVDRGALRYWLLRIEAREAMRLTRRMRRFVRAEASVHEIPVVATVMTDQLILKEAVTKLPRRIRAAIALHYLADLPVRETAAILGVTENTIKSELKTGLMRLRKELADE